ncbi:MAG: PAS domain S-box protein [Planctomycetes bacterium]|nr:PAS domain S-box protein [Planctomycetota bacterium]
MSPRQTFAISFRCAILVFLLMLALREGSEGDSVSAVSPLLTYAPSLLFMLVVIFVIEARQTMRAWTGVAWAGVYAGAALALLASPLVYEPGELTFFLFGFSVATARDWWGGILIGLMGSGGYLLVARYGMWAYPLSDPQILARAGVLLATPTFTGHLSRLADREREERAEQTAELRAELGTLGHHLRRVLDSVSSGVLVVETLSGTVTTYNSAAERILGVAAHRVLGREAAGIEGLQAFLTAVLPSVEGSARELERADFAFTRASDGAQLRIGYGVSPLEDLGGRRLGWIVVFQDVTLIRDYEARMTRQEQLAAVGRLVSGIAHEFGNLLGGARGHAELALSGDLAEKDEALEVIRGSLTRALETVEHLLRFARGTPVHALPGVDLAQVIDQALLLLKPTLASAPVEVQREIESVSVTADAGQLEQVVVNLLINAVHACQERPEPVVRVSLRPDGDGALLCVEDNGPGVPFAEKERIFQPFFTTKGALGGSATPGTGLGLSTSLGVVQAHGGTLDVSESASLGGAKFSLRLPSTSSDPDLA